MLVPKDMALQQHVMPERTMKFRYNIEILQRRVLKRWWFNASVSMKVQARKRITLVKGLEGSIVQHQEEINSLQLQLVETRKSLVAEKQTREALAQDMKRSFMRGVCALNLEAMQVCISARLCSNRRMANFEFLVQCSCTRALQLAGISSMQTVNHCSRAFPFFPPCPCS